MSGWAQCSKCYTIIRNTLIKDGICIDCRQQPRYIDKDEFIEFLINHINKTHSPKITKKDLETEFLNTK